MFNIIIDSILSTLCLSPASGRNNFFVHFSYAIYWSREFGGQQGSPLTTSVAVLRNSVARRSVDAECLAIYFETMEDTGKFTSLPCDIYDFPYIWVVLASYNRMSHKLMFAVTVTINQFDI